MATLEKAEGLLEQLRGASHDAAVKDMEELRSFASENVSSPDIWLSAWQASDMHPGSASQQAQD